MELRVLGAVNLRRRRGDRVREIGTQPKRLALLSYLALAQPIGLVRRDALLALLWPELEAGRARNALSQAVHGLRRDLGPDVVVARGHEEVGLSPQRFWCDAVAFQQAVEREDFRTAASLHRGELLPAFHVSGAPEFERWLDGRRARLRQDALEAALRMADQEGARARPLHASRWLRRALDISPTDEVVLRRLVSTLEGLGNRADALLAYEEAAARLRGEYDMEPSPETLALVGAIRARRAADARRREGVAGFANPSVAILPPEPAEAQPEDTYFLDGIAESLTTDLGGMRALRVLSHRSVLHYRRSQESPAAIGAELGVDAVVTSTVVRRDGTVRLTARLVRVAPAQEVWGQAFERPAHEIPAVVAEAARAIAGELAGAGSAAEPRRPPTAQVVNPEVYEAFLRGRYLSGMLAKTAEAIASFQRAIAVDPQYAPAHAGIATCYANLAVFAHVSPAEAAAQLEGAARRAIALDDGLSDAHVALGIGQLVFDRDWAEAGRALRRAVELNPSSAYARAYRSVYLSTLGWTDEGVAEAAQAAALDPLDPWPNFLHGFALYRARRYEASLARLHLLLELYPHHPLAQLFVAENELKCGRPDRAAKACRTALALLPQDQLLMGIGACVLGLAGQRREARRLLAALEARGARQYVNPAFLAAACAGLGQRDAAFAHWERMLQDRAPSAFLLKTDPLFDCVRSDPRFQEVLRRLGLADVTA